MNTSNAKHTVEPWQPPIEWTCHAKTTIVRDVPRSECAGGRITIAEFHAYDTATAEADAARAVACVNACAGIDDPAATLTLAREALRKILRHIPEDWGGCSVSADVDLCKQALRALGE